MKVSECCGATFYEPGYPDNDICSACREHAEPMEEDEPSINVIEMPPLPDNAQEIFEKLRPYKWSIGKITVDLSEEDCWDILEGKTLGTWCFPAFDHLGREVAKINVDVVPENLEEDEKNE